VPICDGCGGRVDEAHVRERIERLELATRYRPIHIQVLLIDAAPAKHRADFFYEASSDRGKRSAAGQAYFDELAKLAGGVPETGAQTEAVLTEFQRRGFFLTSAVECSIENDHALLDAVRRLASTVVRRVDTSYKPRSIALISDPTRAVIEPFKKAGWGDRLILAHGAPFASPFADRLLAALPAAAAPR
jgi:hypothetical protein